MARFYLILGALVWLALRSCHADGRVFVLERQNTSESGEEWAKQACAERSSRLASVSDLWHAILECSFAVCTRGWMDGTTVGTTVCKNENGAGLRTVDVKVEDDIVEEEERQLNAFCVKDEGAPCGAPPTFPHTHLQSQTGLELGDELLFVCESGYSLASGDTSFSLLCDSCGEWYGLVQLCVKDDAEAHLDYEDKFPEGANVYEDGGSQAEERGEEEEEQRQSRESHTEGTSEGTDGVTHEREEDGHAAEGHENAGEETEAGNAELVTDPPVSVLSQKHLFWFPSEAFHDDDHVDTHTSDHKHSGAKETESGVEGAVDQGHHDEDPTEEVEEGQYHDPIEEEHHDGDHSTVEQHGNVHVKEEHQEHDHVEEELHEDDHAEEKHYDKGQVEEEFHEDDHTEEEHHEKGHVEEEHHEGGHVEEEHHEGGHVEEEHHEGGHVEEEHHEGGHVEEEHHEKGHVEEEHHEGGHVEEKQHEGGHVEEEHYEDGHVEEEHHEDGHVEEEHHGNGHVKEHHDDHTEEELPTDEVLQHTNKSWLDGYPVDEEFTKSTEIGSEEKEVTDSREVEESEKSEEYEKSIEGSEETFKGVIKHPDAVEMHPTFFLNVSDITTALPYLHTSMESLNGDGSDVTTPSGVGPYEMTLDTTATPVVYGSKGTTAPKFFLHTSLPTESNEMTVFAEDITSVPFHVALSPDDVTAKDELESPALTTVLPDDVTSLSTDVPSVLIHDISGVDSDHHNLTKQSMPTDNPCEADACPSSRSSSLAAIITVGVIVAVVGLALGAWLYRRRQQKSSHYQFNGTNSHTQNFEMQQTV